MAYRPQYRVSRKIATVPITAGGFITVDLPRDYDYESIFLRIAGTVQVTTAYSAVRAEAPCQAVQRVEILADGKNTLFSAPFWFACVANQVRPLNHNGSRATTPPAGFAVATYTVEALGAVDFSSLDCVRPKDSNFRSSGLSLFQARFTFGAVSDLFVGAGVGTFPTLMLEVWAEQMVELPDSAGQIARPGFVKKISYQEIALLSSNVNQELRLPAGNLIKSVMLRTEGNPTAGEPSALVLNNLQLAAGVDVRLNMTGPQLRAKNNMEYGAFNPGYYIADVTRQGQAVGFLSELWDVGSTNEPKLIMDVTGGAAVKMQAVVTEYLPA